MDLFDDFEDLMDDAPPAVPPGLEHALVPAGQDIHQLPDGDPFHLVLGPGEVSPLSDYLTHPDPLSMAPHFRFEGFAFHGEDHLVDTDGDGIPDHTCWGTPVVSVDEYVRADGTVVESHFRTAADGHRWNNLSEY
jgi:hypothetical protein